MIGWLIASALAAPTLVMPAADPAPSVGSSVALAFVGETVACALTREGVVEEIRSDGVAVSLPPFGWATARWAQTQGRLDIATGVELADCAGLPPVHRVAVPTGGLAVGLKWAPVLVEAAQADAVPLGDAVLAMALPEACGEDCVGEVAVVHADQPPTLFRLVPDPSTPAFDQTLRVPTSGALIVKVGTDAAWYLPGLRTAHVGDRLLLLASDAGVHDGFVLAGGVPQRVRVQVGGGFGLAREPEVVVGAGKARRAKLDRAAHEHWVADSRIAQASLDGRGLKVSGVSPGTTHVALRDEAGLRLIRVVVR